LDYFHTPEQQGHALGLLQFKLNILWSMLDAMILAYCHEEPPFHTCEGKPYPLPPGVAP